MYIADCLNIHNSNYALINKFRKSHPRDSSGMSNLNALFIFTLSSLYSSGTYLDYQIAHFFKLFFDALFCVFQEL